MPASFQFSRVGLKRLMVTFGEYRSEYLEGESNQIPKVLSFLGLNRNDPVRQRQFQQSLDQYYFLEQRAFAKFGPERTFRIWRINDQTLQIDFKGGHAELKANASGDPALKRCLADLGANGLLLPDLKRELKEFLKNEKPEPLPDVLFFREAGKPYVLIGSKVYEFKMESEAALLALAKKLKLPSPERLLATYREFHEREKRIREVLEGNEL